MTSNSNDRLDRIEALLQQSAIASNEGITRLEESSLAVDKRLEQMAARVEETTANVNNLSATVDRLTASAQEDRVVMYEMLDQLVIVRDENKQILEYLFGQQRGNGSGDPPQP